VRINRNYRPLQVFLDLFAVFLLYVFFYSFIRGFFRDVAAFNAIITASGSEKLRINPYPVVIWAGLAVILCIATFILPFIFVKKTDYSQKQYDIWVYAVQLIRITGLVTLMCIMGEHMHILYKPVESNPTSVLMGIIMIIIIVRFTKHRIRLLEKAKKKYTITED